MHDVRFEHPDYREFAKRAREIYDVIDNKVKERRTAYLPMMSPLDTSPQNLTRYEQYKMRATFVNYTGSYITNVVGTAFTKVPVLAVPEALKYIEDDADGEGSSIYQQSQRALKDVLACARSGILVDFPNTEIMQTRDRSAAEVAKDNLKPQVILFNGRDIINWQTKKVGYQTKLSLVVIRQTIDKPTEDGFGVEQEIQYLVLKLDDIGYKQEIHEFDPAANKWRATSERYIYDGFKKIWQEIPFTFIGANNNDYHVDDSPIYPMVTINLAHYRNSADYEHGVFFCGVPQVWVSGLDQTSHDQITEHGINFGSSTVFPVPAGGQLGIAQADFSRMGAGDAMERKERQMMAIGMRIIEAGGAAKTRIDAANDSEIQHSILSLACSNISEAYTHALRWMAQFLKMNPDGLDLSYNISQEFNRQRVDPALLTAVINTFNASLIPQSDVFRFLRESGLIDPEKDDEEIKDEIENTLTTLRPGAGLFNSFGAGFAAEPERDSGTNDEPATNESSEQ